MSPSPAPVALQGSRLVRFLSGLAVTDSEPDHADFAWRFGQLIGLTQSIKLEALHGELATLSFEPQPAPADAAKQEFLRIRQSLIRSIVDAFTEDSDDNRPRTGFPQPPANTESMPAAFEPCQRFYAARQRTMEYQIKHLQSYVRDAATCRAPALARLAALDEALGEILLAHQRRSFAVVPGLLARRFEQLRQADNDGWFETFRAETRSLLLAELDDRLQLVLGLIEAIDEHPPDE